MSRLVTSGIESQILTGSSATSGEGQGISTTGIVTIDTANPRSGLACASCGPGAENKIDINYAGVLGRSYFLRQAVRFSSTAPTINSNFMQVWSSGGGTLLQVLQHAVTGEITVWNNKAGVTLVNTGFFPAANSYYLYELKTLVPAAGEGKAKLLIRDNSGALVYESAEFTTNLGNSAVSAFTLGHLSSSGESAVTILVDDIALNDDQGFVENSFPGPGKVVLLKPKFDFDRVGFVKGAAETADLYKALDNFPPIGTSHTLRTSESQIYSPNNNETDKYEAGAGPYSAPVSEGGGGIDANDRIKCVMGIARGSTSSATSRNLRLWVGSNPSIAKTTKSTSGEGGADPTGWTTITTVPAYPSSGSINLDEPARPLVEKGTASVSAMAYDMLGVYVEYEPRTTVSEQLDSMPVTHNLQSASLPSAFTQMPWSGNSGSFSESLGWSPSNWLEEYLGTKAGSRSGIYYNAQKFIGGNVATILQRNSAFVHAEKRQFSVWAFSEMGASASGYQLVAWQPNSTADKYIFKLRKWVGGVESLLSEVAGVEMQSTGSFAIAVYNGNVTAWVKKTEESPWAQVAAVADSTFKEGYSGVDGNGSNPRLANFKTAAIGSVIEEFIFAPSGSSASSGSIADEFTLTDAVSGSSASSGSEVDVFTFEEPASGSSESSGLIVSESGELIAMTLEGSSTSSGTETDSHEAQDQMSGSSSSTGSSIDVEEAFEVVSGSSSSTGTSGFSFSIVDSLTGVSASSFSSTDEVVIGEGPSGISGSTGSAPDSAQAGDSMSGGSNSNGSLAMEFEKGTPPQPEIFPVQPRQRKLAIDWRLFLCNSDTMELLGEINQARGRQFQLALNKPGGCNFSVPLDYDLFEGVEGIKYGVIAYRGKIPRFSGMIWNIDKQTQSNSIAVQCVGWFETLNHRILREDVGYPPFSTGTISGGQIVFLPAQGTVGNVNYHPGGLLTIANAQRDTWIVEGSNSDTIKRIISYQKGQNIGQAITQLTEVEAGFDFEIDPLSRVMDLRQWNEAEDRSEDVVFGYNWGPSNIDSLGEQFDPSTMANRVTALGKFGGGFAEDVESQDEYQLFEEMPQLNDVVDPNVMLAYAGGEVLLRNRPRILYSFQPFPYSGSKKVPRPFDDYDLGNIISFTAIRKPNLEVVGQKVRVFGMNVDVTDEGNEKVTALQISP